MKSPVEKFLRRDYQKKSGMKTWELYAIVILMVGFSFAFLIHTMYINHDPLFNKAHAFVPASLQAQCAYEELYPEKVINPKESPCNI